MEEEATLDSEVWNDLSGMLDPSELEALVMRALDEAARALELPLQGAAAPVHKAAGGAAVVGASRLHLCLAALESRLKADDLEGATKARTVARAALAATRAEIAARAA